MSSVSWYRRWGNPITSFQGSWMRIAKLTTMMIIIHRKRKKSKMIRLIQVCDISENSLEARDYLRYKMKWQKWTNTLHLANLNVLQMILRAYLEIVSSILITACICKSHLPRSVNRKFKLGSELKRMWPRKCMKT